MLTEQRFERILERLKVKKSITVAEITEDLGISESTARRDITALDKAGKLTKVFGGAVAAEHTYEMKEPTVAQKVNVRKEEKIKIAQYAADMIGDNDFVCENVSRLYGRIFGEETGGVCNERSRTRAASGGSGKSCFTYRR